MPDIIFSEGSGLNDALYGNWQAPLQAVIMKRAEAFEQKSLYKKLFKTVSFMTQRCGRSRYGRGAPDGLAIISIMRETVSSP